MKIFNVSVRVSITQIAELPDLPPEPEADAPAKKPFNDDPVDKQEGMIQRYLDRLEKLMERNSGGGFAQMAYGQEPAGASMAENVRIAASEFDDLQAILKKFSETIKALPAAPDSLLASIQARGPMPAR